jgi:hypothetical protein
MVLEAVIALSMLAIMAIFVLTLSSSDARGELGRAYVRRFQVVSENQCPTLLGKSFWFACASEARRSSGVQPADPPKSGRAR